MLFLKHKIPYWDIQGRDLRVTLVKNSWTFLYVSNGYQTFINRKSHVWSTFGYSLSLFAKSGNSLKTLHSSRVSTNPRIWPQRGLGWGNGQQTRFWVHFCSKSHDIFSLFVMVTKLWLFARDMFGVPSDIFLKFIATTGLLFKTLD